MDMLSGSVRVCDLYRVPSVENNNSSMSPETKRSAPPPSSETIQTKPFPVREPIRFKLEQKLATKVIVQVMLQEFSAVAIGD
ncbi:hypothetical protein C0J52_13185 [Blattella germanica]|nr:hypothetical protein C0J52_13185 [Blattella germanica]